MKIRKVLPLALVVMLTGCEKELDFKYHYIEPLTVIEGELSPEGAKIALTMTTPMGEPMDRMHRTDAEVILTDMTTSVSERLDTDEEGFYISKAGGIVGHSYQLKVERGTDTWNGETTMFAPVEILKVDFSWIKMPYDHVAVLQCLYTDDPSTKGDSYRIKVFRNGEIYSWAEQLDWTANNGVMNFVTMTTRQDLDEEDDDDILRDGDVVTVKVYRISQAMREYIEAIGNDSSGPMMFTGPTRCLGYFMANSPVEQSIIFRPDQIPFN